MGHIFGLTDLLSYDFKAPVFSFLVLCSVIGNRLFLLLTPVAEPFLADTPLHEYILDGLRMLFQEDLVMLCSSGIIRISLDADFEDAFSGGAV